jgi:predicted ATPase/DNA-binding SARP family transcriptional activator
VAGPDRLEFRILGPLEVRRNGELVEVGGLRQRALLALLLLHPNEALSADRLIEELWADKPPPTALHTVQVFVSRLRKALGAGSLLTKGHAYAAQIDPDSLDLRRFRSLVFDAEQARDSGRLDVAVECLRTALELWRGPPLADFMYEPFARHHVERLEEERLVALEERLELELALGRHTVVVPELEELAASERLRERVHEQLMLALYRSGRQSDALNVYRTLRRALVEELGIEPSPAARELHRRLLAQDPALELEPQATAAAPPRLPRASTPFLGRARELAEVTALLERDDVRLLTLTGAGGSGKTRLAHQAATSLEREARFEGGIWWVPLQAVRDPELVMPTIAQAIGSPNGLDTHIGESEMLLVIDNFEQVTGAAVELADLLGVCSRLRLLVTSRERLSLAGERVYAVQPLADDEAVELFVARAQATGTDFPADTVREVCRRVDNLPLAIELAAARTAVFEPQQLLERLEQALGFLTRGPRDAPERHRTVRATIEWSYELLTADEKMLFAHLSVFSGGFTLAAAEEVCDGDADVLHSLIDKSLLRGRLVVEGRFRMLETIREFARELLEREHGAAELRTRHCRYFARWLAVLKPDLDVFRPAAIDAVEAESGNVRAALAYAAANEPLVLTRLVTLLDRYWATRGWFKEAEEWSSRALTTCPADATAERAGCLLAFGTALLCRGDAAGARAALHDSAALLREGNEPRQLARALNQLGAAAFDQRDLTSAAAAFEESVEVAERAGAVEDALRARGNLGAIMQERGDAAGAFVLFEEQAAAAAAIGDDRNVALAVANQGICALELGDLDKAEYWLRHGLPLLQAVEWVEPIVYVVGGLSHVAQRTGDPERAVVLAAAAENLAVSLGLNRQDNRDREDLLVALRLDLGDRFDDRWREAAALDPWEVVSRESERRLPEQA